MVTGKHIVIPADAGIQSYTDGTLRCYARDFIIAPKPRPTQAISAPRGRHDYLPHKVLSLALSPSLGMWFMVAMIVAKSFIAGLADASSIICFSLG